jgi:hypothetical protein
VIELVDWLRATIERDKTGAQLVTCGGYQAAEWRVGPTRGGRWPTIEEHARLIGETDADVPEVAVIAFAEDGRNQHEHIARHDPRDVIARCEADLAILARCERVINADWGDRDETGHFITVPIASRLAREMVHVLAWGYRFRDLAGYTEVAGGWTP